MMGSIVNDFNRAVAQYLQDNALSEAAFAKQAKVGESTINRIVTGKITEPRPRIIMKIAKAMGVNYTTLGALINPDLASAASIKLESELWAAQIEKLTDEQKRLLRIFLDGLDRGH